MYYRHDKNITYPERSDQHMLELKRTRELKLDPNYNYMPKGACFKIGRAAVATLLHLIVFPLMRLTHGLKIYGRENLKKHKAELKDGAITISNHVFMWDYLAVQKAIRPHISYFPAWKPNFESGWQPFMRALGGMPIPEDFRSLAAFKRGMDEVVASGKWLHVFPEGSMWYFYPDIRPLKPAVFTYAVKYDKPLIPISMSFRPRKKGLLWIFGQGPCIDLHIAEPIYANKELPPRAAAEELRARAYKIMQEMNGIKPGDPTYNENQDINTYQKTMG